MSEVGVFAVARSIFDHPMLGGEPFTRREAWLWLVAEAAFKAGKRRAGSAIIAVRRGEVAHSIRFMADAWQWHRARVERFLHALKTEAMIKTRTETGTTVISICKYDEYQKVGLPDETQSARDASKPRQQRDSNQDNKSVEPQEDTLSGETPSETHTETVARQPRDRLEEGNKGKDTPSLCSGGRAPAKGKMVPLPDDWRPSETSRAKARERGFSESRIDAMAEAMRSWAQSIDARKVSWDATFDGWVRREAERIRTTGPPYRKEPGIGAVALELKDFFDERSRKDSASCSDAGGRQPFDDASDRRGAERGGDSEWGDGSPAGQGNRPRGAANGGGQVIDLVAMPRRA